MAAQKRSSNRNYIDLLEDGDGGRLTNALPSAPGHPIRDYLLGLVAAMRPSRSEAR